LSVLFLRGIRVAEHRIAPGMVLPCGGVGERPFGGAVLLLAGTGVEVALFVAAEFFLAGRLGGLEIVVRAGFLADCGTSMVGKGCQWWGSGVPGWPPSSRSANSSR